MENELPIETYNDTTQQIIQPPVMQPQYWTPFLPYIIVGIITVLGSGIVGYQIGKKQTNTNTLSPTTQTVPNIAQNGVTFSGIITEIDNSCASDGICRIKVGDKWVVGLAGGLRWPGAPPEIRGELIGINFNSLDKTKYIGKKVEVYAKKTEGDNYTIYDNKLFYIKILE
ncbi:MAG: hypothetical protein NTV98_04200 [Candidatus Roizmanbacteria bacterium]|nr:hypothetical protein [Candidatus Roizmanbacteria bacterium]